MKKSNMFGQCILVAVGALLLQAAPVFADEGSSVKSGGMETMNRHFDWVQHTQRGLDELKHKLNLAPEQIGAWDTWSHGVVDDARQQLEQRKFQHEEKGPKAKPMADETTPERMADGIAHLRTETKWMQEHLVRLEAAQARTAAFYNTLSVNQKTIFDLFWKEMHHRVSGHGDGMGMHEHGADDCRMMGQQH